MMEYNDNDSIAGAFAFVIMPFSDEMQPVYDGAIKRACSDLNMRCERVDEQIFNEAIVQRVYEQIRKADIVIAELSEPNPNVYYELGFARALGKKIVFLTKSSSKIPYDLQAYKHLVYDDRLTLYDKLPNFLIGCYKDDIPFNEVLMTFESSSDAQGQIAVDFQNATKTVYMLGNNFHIVVNDRRALLLDCLRRSVKLTFVVPPIEGNAVKDAAKTFGMSYESLKSQCSHSLESLLEFREQAKQQGWDEYLNIYFSDDPPQYRAYAFNLSEPNGKIILIPYFNNIRSSHCPTYEIAVSGAVGKKYKEAMLTTISNSRKI